MSNGRDGGKWALAGFLYQIVGMLSITARAYGPIAISNRDESNEVDALLTLIGVGGGLQAHHERFEQDAVFARDDECVLVQFKYSTAASSLSERQLPSEPDLRYNCGHLNKLDICGEENDYGTQIQDG